jgi:hypothetical protein
MTPPQDTVYPENQLPQHTKVCPKCGIEKPIDDFYRRNERVNRSSYCKKCCNAYKPKQTIFPTVKICCCVDCIHTGEEQSVSNFHRNHRKRDGYNPSCKDCVREASKRFRLNNPEKIRQWQKEWAEENPEKFNAKKLRANLKRRIQREAIKELGVKNIKKFTHGWSRNIMWGIKPRAEKKGVPFDMKESDLVDTRTGKLPEFCPIFPHIKLDYDAGSDRRTWACVDRIVPELGYTSGNVWVISQAANTWKSNGSNPAERSRIVEIMIGRTKKKVNVQQPSLFDNL